MTEFDRATEAMVVDRLRRERPDDSIVGEEGANHRGTSGYEWHIDPIDGTVNFVYDLPGWCTSIAVLHDGQPVAGAVYAPVVDELYSAGLGNGTTINGAAVTVSGSTDLATSLAATGFSYHLDDHRHVQAARIARVLPTVRDIRRQGSAALDLAYVASGPGRPVLRGIHPILGRRGRRPARHRGRRNRHCVRWFGHGCDGPAGCRSRPRRRCTQPSSTA